ncbi:uncharacterized protein LOC8285981 [Ricinus communis]|uniref:uncharacterized protein LOC8285981 n=1 Tax=Ricinus communis TaxID=3988 RepID=UPI000772C412|nr:uncharacterized protein LOC8285981 [Ricinus communis]|eukprot:XP_015579137.1 uncharacterized protein LOC8285981 [Ricinus communis]
MEDFSKKVTLKEPVELENSSNTLLLLRRFLHIQQRRAQAYANLKRGFDEYMVSGGELAYQQLCSEITLEFSDCSKQVLEMEGLFQNYRLDLAQLLRAVQTQEKHKLHLTATIQVLKKAGHPSERLVSHENCRFTMPMEHECVHVSEITEAAGTEEAEADAEYDAALKEAIRGVQDAVTAINDHIEEVKYEIAALEAE